MPLDQSFGENGVLLVSVGSDTWGRDVLLDAQQRIIVVGEAALPNGRDLLIMRLTPEGQPDTALGSGGFVTVDLGGRDEATRHAILDGQGRLLVSGWLDDESLADSFIARFLM